MEGVRNEMMQVQDSVCFVRVDRPGAGNFRAIAGYVERGVLPWETA